MIKLREYWFEDAELKVNIDVTIYYVIDNGNHRYLIDYNLADHVITMVREATLMYTILPHVYVKERWEDLKKVYDLSKLNEPNQKLVQIE